ncbi:longitudinals lacking protein-like [Diabrotica virgifera virgifera]|uniref:Longitudinals lacking protein-like n=1 Tax=Diabrotica virgifera virgifera TaxID=50390 RepID=A0A6P7G1T1_DIAVI|nr:longitudinals lacking protein-like [Diabrotica virgifera virgifera]
MEDSELFGLRWDNYQSNLAASLYSLYKDMELCDVTISADGKSLRAHKNVLSVCSPYFKELFMANPGKDTTIILHGVDYNTLCSILEFIYQGEVTICQEEYEQFIRVAETLKLQGPTNNSSSLSSVNWIYNIGFTFIKM